MMLSSSILFCRRRLLSSGAVTSRASSSTMVAAAATATSSLSSISAISISSSLWFSSYAQQQQQQSPIDKRKDPQEFVSVLKLNMLQDNPGAVKKRRRIGRGIGSSKGKTSGRGHKGQKARSGGSIPLFFEGGQTRFFKLLPKRGFTNKRHKAEMVSLNVGTIQDYIDMGRFPTTISSEEGSNKNVKIPVWTMKDLLDAGLFTASSVKHGIKLLGQGKERLRTPFRLEISRASESAIAAIEAIGGEVTTVHYNNLALRALLKPHKFGVQQEQQAASPTKHATQTTNKKAIRQIPKFARPPPKWQPYYTNWENRGYLSVQAQMRKLLLERPELEEKFAKTLKIEIDNDNDDEKEE